MAAANTHRRHRRNRAGGRRWGPGSALEPADTRESGIQLERRQVTECERGQRRVVRATGLSVGVASAWVVRAAGECGRGQRRVVRAAGLSVGVASAGWLKLLGQAWVWPAHWRLKLSERPQCCFLASLAPAPAPAPVWGPLSPLVLCVYILCNIVTLSSGVACCQDEGISSSPGYTHSFYHFVKEIQIVLGSGHCCGPGHQACYVSWEASPELAQGTAAEKEGVQGLKEGAHQLADVGEGATRSDKD